MAKLTIQITHIDWRDGRPRFEPGPTLRARSASRARICATAPQGDGSTRVEAKTWADVKEKEIASAARRPPPLAPARSAFPPMVGGRGAQLVSVAELFELYFQSPRMKGETVEDGKRRQKAAARRPSATTARRPTRSPISTRRFGRRPWRP